MSDKDRLETFSSGIIGTLLLWVVSLLGAFGAILLAIFPAHSAPAEDAIILFQFSRNLAESGSISYIPHGLHAEGATDFLWMVMLSAAIKLGANPFWTIAVMNVMALFGIALLLLHLARVQPRLVNVFFVMGVVVMLPQMIAAALGFSTLPYAGLLLLLILMWVQENDSGTSLAALLLCLFRPDGVVIALPLLLAALVLHFSARRLALYSSVFALPGVAYFLWRWYYFGQLLPLPFYVKAHAPQRVAHLIVAASLRDGRQMLLVTAILLVLLVAFVRLSRRTVALLLCTVIVPTLFYTSVRLEQNVAQRFFIYMPMAALAMIAINWKELNPRQRQIMLYAGLVSALLLVRIYRFDYDFYTDRVHLDRRLAVARELATIPHGTMIVTEAGMLPYYSRWTPYDAWGLNTAQFSKRLIQPSDVAAIHPDLMLVFTGGNECVTESSWQVPYTDRSWTNMTRNLITAAHDQGFDTWLLPYETDKNLQRDHLLSWQGPQECWFVRHSSQLQPSIAAILQRHGAITQDHFMTLMQAARLPLKGATE
jgi:hypothetical protein